MNTNNIINRLGLRQAELIIDNAILEEEKQNLIERNKKLSNKIEKMKELLIQNGIEVDPNESEEKDV